MQVGLIYLLGRHGNNFILVLRILLLLLLVVLENFDLRLLFIHLVIHLLFELVVLLAVVWLQVLHYTDATSVLVDALSSLDGVKSVLVDLLSLHVVLIVFIGFLLMLVMNLSFILFFDIVVVATVLLLSIHHSVVLVLHVVVHRDPVHVFVLVLHAIVHLVLVLVGLQHTGLVLLIPVLMISFVLLHSVLKIVKSGLSVVINLILHSLCSKIAISCEAPSFCRRVY